MGGNNDWHLVEGPPSDLQGWAAPSDGGIQLAANEYERLVVFEMGMEDES